MWLSIHYGLTADCGEGCACLRYARVGMVPSPVSLEMRSAWGDLKTIEVKPLAVAGVCSLGRVLVYLLDVGRREEVGGGPSWVVSAVASGVGTEAGEVSLTPREVEVLRLVVLGWGNEFIAEELQVTVFTVRTHIANLRRSWVVQLRISVALSPPWYLHQCLARVFVVSNKMQGVIWIPCRLVYSAHGVLSV